MARPVEHIEFTPADTSAVVGRMATLRAAADGWINLLPGVDDAEVAPPSAQGPLASMFGTGRTDLSMATWMPAHPGRRATPASLGIMHATGRAVPLLRQAGLEVPVGWRVRQDHVRRGLVLEVPEDADDTEVLSWSLRATATLCPMPTTGSWQADVHLPRSAGR